MQEKDLIFHLRLVAYYRRKYYPNFLYFSFFDLYSGLRKLLRLNNEEMYVV